VDPQAVRRFLQREQVRAVFHAPDFTAKCGAAGDSHVPDGVWVVEQLADGGASEPVLEPVMSTRAVGHGSAW
jgi:hypothetical protein